MKFTLLLRIKLRVFPKIEYIRLVQYPHGYIQIDELRYLFKVPDFNCEVNSKVEEQRNDLIKLSF